MARILLVEDEPDIALVARVMLEDAGHEVTVAYSGRRGLAVAMQEHPELIITDFMMPGMTGQEMVQQLRDAGCHPPVVMATAVDEENLPEPHLYDIYLGKPYGLRELLGATAKLTSGQS